MQRNREEKKGKYSGLSGGERADHYRGREERHEVGLV